MYFTYMKENDKNSEFLNYFLRIEDIYIYIL